MFSSALEAAGYRVMVVGRSDALLDQPEHIGDIAVETVPSRQAVALARESTASLVSRLSERAGNSLDRTRHGRQLLRWWRARQTEEPDHASFAQTLDSRSAELILAMDPTALAVGRGAAGRARSRGIHVRLAYDHCRRLSTFDETGRGRESVDLAGVELGIAASTELASDESWPDALCDRVPTIYSAPLDLAVAQRDVTSMRRTLKGTQRPRVGLFLMSPASARESDLLEGLVGQLALGRPVIFAAQGALDAMVRRRSWCAVEGILQRAPDDDDLGHLVTQLDIVVCPSAWNPDSPPTPVALACAARGTELVASPAVVEEIGTGHGARAVSAEALAEAIYRAAAAIAHTGRTQSDRPSRPQFGYVQQLETLREQLESVRDPKLGIGPRNGNGQAWAWAQAVRHRRPTLSVEVFAAQYATGPLAMSHSTDVSISLADWKRREWQFWWAHRIRAQYSHLLLEQGLTASGWLKGKLFFDELPSLLRSDLTVGLVFRGSEIRDPAAHAARERWSPFTDPDDPLTAKLQAGVEVPRQKLAEFDVPMFVTTLDLLDDVPNATWLPQVLDLEEWRPGPRILERSCPVVLHAPSRTGSMKGSHWVDDVCQPLHEAGLIDYRRLRGVPFAEMPTRVREADIVIDQLALGSYGVLALQAMASERLVIGHVSERVRGRLDEPIPVLQAEPPELRRVLEEVLAARDWARAFARAGRDYVCRYHGGDESAMRLLDGLVDA